MVSVAFDCSPAFRGMRGECGNGTKRGLGDGADVSTAGGSLAGPLTLVPVDSESGGSLLTTAAFLAGGLAADVEGCGLATGARRRMRQFEAGKSVTSREMASETAAHSLRRNCKHHPRAHWACAAGFDWRQESPRIERDLRGTELPTRTACRQAARDRFADEHRRMLQRHSAAVRLAVPRPLDGSAALPRRDYAAQSWHFRGVPGDSTGIGSGGASGPSASRSAGGAEFFSRRNSGRTQCGGLDGDAFAAVLLDECAAPDLVRRLSGKELMTFQQSVRRSCGDPQLRNIAGRIGFITKEECSNDAHEQHAQCQSELFIEVHGRLPGRIVRNAHSTSHTLASALESGFLPDPCSRIERDGGG